MISTSYNSVAMLPTRPVSNLGNVRARSMHHQRIAPSNCETLQTHSRHCSSSPSNGRGWHADAITPIPYSCYCGRRCQLLLCSLSLSLSFCCSTARPLSFSSFTSTTICCRSRHVSFLPHFLRRPTANECRLHGQFHTIPVSSTEDFSIGDF